MSNPIIPPVPPLFGGDANEVPTKDVDGQEELDTDIDDGLVDSADADRAAVESDDSESTGDL